VNLKLLKVEVSVICSGWLTVNMTIVNELNVVDWFSLFSGTGMFYEMVLSWFVIHVPTRISRELQNKQTKAAKRSKASEKRCLEDKTIDANIY
jgi:hypothetical protein